VAGGLPDGIAAVALSDPADPLDTCLVWRSDQRSAAVEAFVAVAREVAEASP
jgi:DNA-binding transcriptional LysR family regulator